MTRYKLHLREWKDCTRCDLHVRRKRVVFVRGVLPCEVLFVGEAPGASEDAIGEPFVPAAPAGRIQQSIINRALGSPPLVSYAITNLLGCIPKDPTGGSKEKEPPEYAIRRCAPKLQEMVSLADPRLIVAVGAKARDWLTPGYLHTIKFHKPIPVVDHVHPAWIARQPEAVRVLAERRCVLTIQDALNRLPELTEDASRPVVQPPF